MEGVFQGFDDRERAVFETNKGPWPIYCGKKEAEALKGRNGQTVQFKAAKPEGKNYWRLISVEQSNFTRVGQATPSVSRPKPPEEQESMFIMGVVGRAMGSGKFEVNDIPLLTKAAKQAWAERNQVQSGNPDEPPLPDSSYGDGPDDGWPGPDV